MTPTTPAQPSTSSSEGAVASPSDPVVEETADELWMPLRSWLDRDPSRSVLLGAIALLVVQALVRGYVALGGWFLYDDLIFIQRATSSPLWSTDYLFTAYNGHVMPGAFVWVHLLNSLAPLNYTVVALTDLALQTVVGVLVYRTLTTLFGRRPAVLVPLAVFLLTVITLPATTWWAAALNQLPGQAAAVGALLCHALYHRMGRLRYGYLGVVSVALGLLFSEKVLLIVPAVFALSLLWFTAGPPMQRLRTCLHEHRRVWLAYAVVCVPYSVWYLVAVPSPVEPTRSAIVVLQTMGTSLTEAVLPALLGGPYGWEELGIGAIAQPPAGVVVLASVVAAVVVTWTVLRRHRAVFGWLVVGAYWALNAAILGATRAAVVGPVIGREYRYATDVALVVAVFGSLSVLPLAGRFALGTPQALLPRRGVAQGVQSIPSPVRTGVGALLAVGLAVAACLSTIAFDPHWRNEISPRFIATAREDIAQRHGEVTLVDEVLPTAAAPRGFALGATTRILEALPEGQRPSFLTDGHATDALRTLDDQGHVRQVQVDGFTNEPGPTKGCGYRVSTQAVSIPLSGTTMPWSWTAEIGYIASLEADTRVSVGDVTTKVHIEPGAHTVFVKGSGAIGSVTIDALSYGTLCTDDVSVGFAKPIPGTGQ